MERIIRSNAVETSNQTGNGGINPSNLSSDSEFASSLANISVKNPKIYGGALAYPVGEESYAQCSVGKLTSDIVLSTASAKNSTTINSDKWSISLQTVFDRPPSAIPYLVLLGSIAFFTIVLTWIWSLRIEEVSHLRGKFVPAIDSKELFKVTRQEVMMNAVETQARQNHSYLVDVKTQKQQLMSIQTRLNEIKALMGENLLAQLTTNPQSVEQLGSMYAVEVSSKDLISKNTSRNRFAAISTADNTIDSFKPNQNAIQAMATTDLLQNLLLKSVRHQSIQIEDQQIKKLAKDITQLQAKLTEAKTRINKIQLNKQQLLSNSIGVIDKPQQNLAGKVFPSKQAISDIVPQFILMAIPNQQAKFIQPGDRIQIKLDTYPQHHQNTIFGKVLSIVDEPNTKILDNATRLQIVMEKDLLINQQLQSNIKVNQTATAKIIHRHRITDMFFDPTDN